MIGEEIYWLSIIAKRNTKLHYFIRPNLATKKTSLGDQVQPLPIDSLIPQIKSSLKSNPNLIIEATPGAGKTTRVPPALLDPEVTNGEVWVLEPRRIAARLSARRVAEELGEKLGETVGYQIRFEDISSSRTRLRFLTEGMLTRRLLGNPTLKGVAAIVLDEFHERHLQSDLALALLRRLQITTRPDLKLIVMSATLDTEPLAQYLGNCPVLRSEGRRYDVTITYQQEYDARPLAEQVAGAVRRMVASHPDGDILIFLHGAAEIKRAHAACSEFAHQSRLLILPLHGELSTSEQDVAIRPARQRKVILATNVAETSITIDGVTSVIDAGLARIATHSPWSGLPMLTTQRVSKASAIQRAGRAGRTQSGHCLRLYSEMDYTARQDYEVPEIRRLDLAGTVLELHALSLSNIKHLEWYESPAGRAIESAENLLRVLGAINQAGELTELGQRMVRFPLHPRQARIFIEAENRGIASRGALIAAMIGERDLRAKSFDSSPKKAPGQVTNNFDLFEQEALYRLAESLKFDPVRLQEQGINSSAALALKRTTEQILKSSQQRGQQPSDNANKETDSNTRIRISLLAGYSDRVAKLQASDNGRGASEMKTLVLANGTIAQLSNDSVIRDAEYLIALDAEEKKNQRSSIIVVRSACAIKADWLFDLFPDSVQERLDVQWNVTKERVEFWSRLCFDQLILAESRLSANQVDMVSQLKGTQLLVEATKKKGVTYFLDVASISRLVARLDFVYRNFPESGLELLDEERIQTLLISNCSGKSSFAELKESLTIDGLLQWFLTYTQRSILNQMAPERTNLIGRKNISINYEVDKPPWIVSRIQDFFGMATSPTIGQGRFPLVLHLLAPNQRPVQITSDLAGFWARHYPQVRRELSRRYPKHAWPENPVQATTKSIKKL